MLGSFITTTTFFCALVYLISKPSTTEAQTQTDYKLNWDDNKAPTPVNYTTAQQQQGEPSTYRGYKSKRSKTIRYFQGQPL
jgi:hypothetical protein